MLTKFRLRMPRHIKSLDGLRAIAVLLVLWCHVPLTLAGYPSSLAEARWWIEPGSLGVDLFLLWVRVQHTTLHLMEDGFHGRMVAQYDTLTPEAFMEWCQGEETRSRQRFRWCVLSDPSA